MCTGETTTFYFQVLVAKGKKYLRLSRILVGLINFIKINLLLTVVALMIGYAEDLEVSQLKSGMDWEGAYP